MKIHLGILKIILSTQHTELLSQKVAEALMDIPKSDTVGVAEIDSSFSDTAVFCKYY